MEGRLLMLRAGIWLSLTLAVTSAVDSRNRKEISCYPWAKVKCTTLTLPVVSRAASSSEVWTTLNPKEAGDVEWEVKIRGGGRDSETECKSMRTLAVQGYGAVLYWQAARGAQPADSVPGSEGAGLSELCWLSQQNCMPHLTQWPLWRTQPTCICGILFASAPRDCGAFPQINIQNSGS